MPEISPSLLSRATHSWTARPYIPFLFLGTLMLLLMTQLYVGFQAGDDKSYLAGALGWVDTFPYVGDNHWSLRHTITVPTALFIRLLGFHEYAVSLTNSIYFILLVAVNAWYVRRYLGHGTAVLATLTMITLPGFIVLATFLDIGIPELLFLSLSFWLYRTAIARPQALAPWLSSGVCLGLAFITRETAASMIIFFGLLFVFKPQAPRSRYMLAFAAFMAVYATDWGYLTAMTHNPLYRFSLDLNHDRVDRFAMLARVASRGGLIDGEGNISVNVFLDPFLNLFISQKYTLLFWLLIPALFYCRRIRGAAPAVLTLQLLAGYALVSFVFLGANPKLYLVPRYFLSTAWAALIIVAYWLAALRAAQRLRHFWLALGALLAVNTVALSVENTNPRFIERQLVAWVEAHPNERLYTDLETIEKARYLFGFGGVAMTSLSFEAPPPGATFFYSADRLALCASSGRCRARVSSYTPRADWQELERIRPAPRPIGRLLHALGLDRLIPEDIARRLMYPGGNVSIYRVGGAG